ncbi:permease [Photobacterium jeanii]|uniref:Probable membrane transporter protein n=1 Tax=Photobacterium jeanii TaxID=858640 RepID=A0A178KM20_9GAMM|nr:sulfite exporter TauE/SafE family protein [Photobacterium jeanii]OAN18317.1 permease [Photobacterium jeanii]PST92003.1 sulfite exporter TauE/SafE family protein [Photobacterium jeanii]
MDWGIALAMLMIFIGSYVQSTIGFGLAIVTAPILFQISPAYVPGPITITALFLSLINAHKFRANISIKGLGYALIGRIPGIIAGGALLYFIAPKVLSLWIGGIVLAAVAISLMPIRLQPTNGRLAVAGFFSGLFGTSTGIGGPPMALLLQHQQADLIRANLSAFFVVSSLLSLIAQVPAGHMGMQHLYLSLPLLPASFLGYVLAMRTVNRINKKTIRIVSLGVCCLSASAAIISALTMQ